MRVVRSGGLAGIALRGEADTAELTSEQATAAEEHLRKLPVDKPPAAPRHPDGFQYALEFQDAGGQSRAVTLDESEVGDELRPLIQRAMDRGTPG